MRPGELAARADQAEKRWDARVGRAMDVALPIELSTKRSGTFCAGSVFNCAILMELRCA